MNTDPRRGTFIVLMLAIAAGALTALPGCIVVVSDGNGEWESGEWREDSKPARLGIDTATIGPATAAQLRVNRDRVTLIEEVYAGWPAAEAGLKRYDLITAINTNADASPSRLRQAVRAAKPGEELTLLVLREGQPIEVRVAPMPAPRPPNDTGN